MTKANKAEILGYLAAEGNEYHYTRTYWRFYSRRGAAGRWYLIRYRQDAIEFTNLDLAIQRRFRNLLDKVYSIHKARFDNKGRIRIRPRRIVSELLAHSRLGSLSWQVPKAVINANRPIKAAWCRGYADGDGTVAKTAIYLDSANSVGLEQVRNLLQSIGIQSSLKGPYSKAPHLDRFSLVIYKDSLWQYAKCVGFIHPRKRYALAQVLKKAPVGRRF